MGQEAVSTPAPPSGFLKASNNLSDVPNKATARTNLGVGASKSGTIDLSSGTAMLTDATIPDNAVFAVSVSNGHSNNPGRIYVVCNGSNSFTFNSDSGSDASQYNWVAFW